VSAISPSAPPEVMIRDMGPDDVLMVADVESQAYDFPWSEGIFRDCLRAGYYCCVAEIDHIVIGYGIMSLGAGEAHVLNLCVAEPYRCRGIGSLLLEKAKTLRPAGLRLYAFQRNQRARAFYEARGFAALAFTDGPDNEEREPDVLYQWRPQAEEQ
jgi:ribosomal-protein-alanine N-acetyltransferase